MRVLRDRDLSLDFPKAQKGRVRTVLDCLAHFTHKETVEMRCEKCGKLCDFEKRLRVKRRPPVLVRTPTTCVHSLVRRICACMSQRRPLHCGVGAAPEAVADVIPGGPRR